MAYSSSDVDICFVSILSCAQFFLYLSLQNIMKVLLGYLIRYDEPGTNSHCSGEEIESMGVVLKLPLGPRQV